jgi:hypothetical protein
MLRYSLFLFLSFATTIGGLWAVRFEAENREQPLSLCEVTTNKLLFSGLRLTVRANATSDRYIHDYGCGGEYGEWTNLELLEPSAHVELIDKLDQLNTASQFAYSRVTIEGDFSYIGPNCVSQDSSITNAKIIDAEAIQIRPAD